ncbi:Ltp family lipoprotein [Parasphaerochaeta coccoides]|uniref:Putative host cell surface-exposed lipoprotein Ltp-like HTH region domain-containing protein n=1 Tax=Parasphaerochaeta coccoides (strain ATCC BAA-1237 / DSM 17374 / SPN1) TaxID=760011 RepID=F4GL18_PARC1|nr:hypothetical protein Spico_1140 [Parasphaerochaeta coccoides DSM 17374]
MERPSSGGEWTGYAVDHCGANWNEQAAKKAASYLRSSSVSRTGLYDHLKWEGFIPSQATYDLTQVVDW